MKQRKAASSPADRVLSTVFSRSVISMIFSGIATFLGSIIDGLIIGRELGTVCMSAFQLVMPVIQVIGMLAVFFSAGLQNRYSEYLGSGRKNEAHGVLSLTAAVSLGIGVLVSLGMVLFSTPLARLLGAAEGELLAETRDYILGLAPGMPVILLIPVVSFLLYLEGRAPALFLAIGTMLAVNLSGDLASVFLFRSGMLGMGLASSACYLAAFLVGVLSFVRKKPDFRFRFKGTRPADLAPVLRMGLPTAVERLLVTLQVAFVNHILIGVSLEAVAVYSVIGILNMVLQSTADGVSSTTFTMASVFVGDEDGDSLKTLFGIFTRRALAVGFGVLAAVLALSRPMIGLFLGTKGPEMCAAGVTALRIFVLYFPAYAFIRAYHKYATALGEMRLSFLIPVLENGVLFIPVAYLLSRAAGSVFWASFAIAETLTLSVLLLLALKRKAGEGSFAKALRRIPAPLERRQPDDYSAALGPDMEAVIRCSRDASRFLKDAGAGGRTAYLVSLAVEEMCGNIVKNNPGKADLSMDIRMVTRDGSHIVRIRDNGRAFNPEQWSRIHSTDDPASNIGIRMVAGFAEKFTYTNILGMNNLAIRVGGQAQHP